MGERIIRRPDAIARGCSDVELQRNCRNGSWRRLRPGAYVDGAAFAALDEFQRHRVLAESVVRAAASDSVLSHVSAAIVHGFTVWNASTALVHLTRNRSRGGRKADVRHIHSARYEPDEVMVVDGLPVTTPARTVVDLARMLSFEESIVIGDHALRTTALTRAELVAVLSRVPTHSGNRKALRAIRFMDGRSESVGESRSRAILVREQLPVPEPQTDLYDASGAHLGRVDFLFEDAGVIGEFDGRVKYGRLVPPGQQPSDVLWREKLREDAMRAAGWQVVRWTWDELRTPSVIVQRINDAIARTGPAPKPSGHIVRCRRVD